MSRWKEIVENFKSLLKQQEIKEQEKSSALGSKADPSQPTTQQQNAKRLSNEILHLMKQRKPPKGIFPSNLPEQSPDKPKGPAKP